MKLINLLLLVSFTLGASFQAPQSVGRVTASRSPLANLVLRMAEGDEAEKKVTVSKDGTFYDDEVDPIPAQKEGISDSMKQRLIREASSGLDSDKKQSNVILYIMAIVAALVLLGGQGILY